MVPKILIIAGFAAQVRNPDSAPQVNAVQKLMLQACSLPKKRPPVKAAYPALLPGLPASTLTGQVGRYFFLLLPLVLASGFFSLSSLAVFLPLFCFTLS